MDQVQNPIVGAEIRIRSKRQTTCPNSVPIDDLLLITDQNGNFNTVIPYIAEDDLLEMTVSSAGYAVYHDDYLTYVDFEEPLTITLTETKQSDH